MHIQTFYPTPAGCRWFTFSRHGIVVRIPFARRLVCFWCGKWKAPTFNGPRALAGPQIGGADGVQS